jgi:hypothetical protein
MLATGRLCLQYSLPATIALPASQAPSGAMELEDSIACLTPSTSEGIPIFPLWGTFVNTWKCAVHTEITLGLTITLGLVLLACSIEAKVVAEYLTMHTPATWGFIHPQVSRRPQWRSPTLLRSCLSVSQFCVFCSFGTAK